jgi:MFS family permease
MMDSTPPPSRARYVVLAFLGTLVFVLYLDRICIGKAAPSIESDLGITHEAMGYVFGAFTIAYGLFEVPTGRWGDRFGSRGVITRIVVWWSLFTALTGSVPTFAWNSGLSLPWTDSGGSAIPLVIDSFAALLVVRFLFGAGEAGALPNTARVVSQWFPLHERSMVHGVILMCQQMGGACAPVAAAYLIDVTGWRNTFLIFGSIGALWAVWFYTWFRDDPATHPKVDEAERRLIASGRRESAEGDGHPAIPWRMVVSSSNIWMLGMIMNCSAFAAYMYIFWFPTYLQQGCGVESKQVGWLSGMILAGGAVGAWLGGLIVARIDRWTGEGRWGRSGLGFAGLIVAALSMLAIPQCESPVAVSLCATLASAASQVQIANWWSVVTAISGRHLGALFGLMNSMGVVGGFTSPIFFGAFADWRGRQGFSGRAQWDPGFFLYAVVLALGALCWLLVDATRSAVGDDPEEPAA